MLFRSGSSTTSQHSPQPRHSLRPGLTSGSDKDSTSSTHHTGRRTRLCTLSTSALGSCRFRRATSRPPSVGSCSRQPSGSSSTDRDSILLKRISAYSKSSRGPSGGPRDITLGHELQNSLGEHPQEVSAFHILFHAFLFLLCMFKIPAILFILHLKKMIKC